MGGETESILGGHPAGKPHALGTERAREKGGRISADEENAVLSNDLADSRGERRFSRSPSKNRIESNRIAIASILARVVAAHATVEIFGTNNNKGGGKRRKDVTIEGERERERRQKHAEQCCSLLATSSRAPHPGQSNEVRRRVLGV